MNSPITLKFFRKIEYFQTMNHINGLALAQKSGKTKNTWSIEKKILRWTYRWHKHLGSPILIHHFFPESEAKYKQFEYQYQKWVREHTKDLKNLIELQLNEKITNKSKQLAKIESYWEKFKIVDLNNIDETKIEKHIKDKIERHFKNQNRSNTKKILEIEKHCCFEFNFEEEISKLHDISISDDEFESVKKNIRHVLKNLVMRNYAKFNNSKDEDDGILITPEGLLMGEIIWENTNIDSCCKNMDTYYWYWLYYSFFIAWSWLLTTIVTFNIINSFLEKTSLLDNIIIQINNFHWSNFRVVEWCNNNFGLIYVILFFILVVNFIYGFIIWKIKLSSEETPYKED